MSPDGETKRLVTTLPSDANVWAVGSGKLAAFYAKAIHVVDLRSGTSTSYPPGSGDSFFGGAFSPDGTHLAYVGGTTSSGALRSLDLATATAKTLRTFSSNSWDVPSLWASKEMAGNVVIAYSDAGPSGAFRLNASTGARVAFTNDGGGSGATFAADAQHAADSNHSSLGDEGDVTAGPGPARPFNTLRVFTVGSTPKTVLKKAHHEITVLALSPTGGTVYYYDDSSAGGFAGISQSPDFGLFSMTGTTRHQIAHYDGGTWQGGAFVSGSTLVAAEHAGSNERLMSVHGNSVTTIDTVAAARLSFLGVTTFVS